MTERFATCVSFHEFAEWVRILGSPAVASDTSSVYIRRASELDQVREALDIALLQWKDKVSYLRSDICRAELALEIEATVLGVRVGE